MTEKNLTEDIAIDEFTREIQAEFLTEALFLLETCEEAYLTLDDPNRRSEQLDVIFRAAHSLRGSGSALGLNDLAGFAHVAEDCLSILRTTPHLLTPDIITLLLQAGDALKSRVNQLKSGAKAATWDVSVLRVDLQQTIEALRLKVIAEKDAPAVTSPSSAKQVEGSGPAAVDRGTIVKVRADRIEAVLNMISGVVATSSQLTQSYKSLQMRNSHHDSILQNLDKSIRELQFRAMSMRLTSVKPLFLKVQRTLRDTASQVGKEVEFTMLGEDMEIDRSMMDLLSDPLVHLARNAVDHGLELPSARLGKGKHAAGHVHLTAKQSGGNIIFEFVDDGRGVQRDAVLKKAVERRVVAQQDAHFIADADVYKLLFAPGFSTAEHITELSGRGVGLDVVRTNVEKLRGSVVISSELDRGSTLRIVIPLTASVTITAGLLVSIGAERFIMPLDVVKELIRVEDEHITRLQPGTRVINVRGTTLPLVDSERALAGGSDNIESVRTEATRALVVEDAGHRAAMLVDDVHGQVQVVAMPLPDDSARSHMIAGTAILGDGHVALILNAEGMLQPSAGQAVVH